jgi:nicotinamide-nucleotide amidase
MEGTVAGAAVPILSRGGLNKENLLDEITALAAMLGRQLKALDAQVTSAESCTGGGIAEAITRISGSSAWFEAGYVTYSNRQKLLQLGVPTDLFTTVGAVSREVVEAMVRGAQVHSKARFAVAVSGVAGPDGGSVEKPVGTVWLAWGDGEAVISRRCQFDGDRDQVRRQTVKAALEGLVALARTEIPTQG